MATNITNPPFSGRLLTFMYSLERYDIGFKAEQNPPDTISLPTPEPRARENEIAFAERLVTREAHRQSFSRFGDKVLTEYFRTRLDAMTNLGPHRPEVEKQISQAAHLLRKSGVLDLIPAVGISQADLLWTMSLGHMQASAYSAVNDKNLLGCLKSFENGSIGHYPRIEHCITEANATDVALEVERRKQNEFCESMLRKVRDLVQDSMPLLETTEGLHPEQIETPEQDIFTANRRVEYPTTYFAVGDNTRKLRVAVYPTKLLPKRYRHGEINVHARLALAGSNGASSGYSHLYFKLSGKKRKATLFKVSIPEKGVELMGTEARRYGRRLMKLFAEERLDEYREVRARVANLRTQPDPRNEVVTPTRDELEEWSDTWSFSKGVSRQMFGTTIFFYPHARALPGFPEIAADASAVVVYFGGSGTPKSSGVNAMRLANALQRYDISTIGFDYPFHAQGPYDQKYLKGIETMGMMRDIVVHYASAGLPIYLVGHSMGPSRIQELLHTAPEDMERKLAMGALMFAPALCIERQREICAELNTAGATWIIDGNTVEGDPAAEQWEQAMDNDTVSLHGDSLDIHVPVKVVASDNDPYSTPDVLDEITRRFPNGTLEVLKGHGHAGIFEQRVKSSGEILLADRVLRFIEEVSGEKLGKSDRTKIASRSMVKYLHYNSALFRKWLYREGKSVESCVKNEKIAGGILVQWEKWMHYRVYVMAKYVMDYKSPGDVGEKKLAKARRILAKPFKDISRDEIVLLTQVVIASN